MLASVFVFVLEIVKQLSVCLPAWLLLLCTCALFRAMFRQVTVCVSARVCANAGTASEQSSVVKT